MALRKSLVCAVAIAASLGDAPLRAAEPSSSEAGEAGHSDTTSVRQALPVQVVVVVDAAYDPELAQDIERTVVETLHTSDIETARHSLVKLAVVVMAPPANGTDLGYSMAVRIAGSGEPTSYAYSCTACNVAALVTEIATTVELRVPEIRAAIKIQAPSASPATTPSARPVDARAAMPPSKYTARQESFLLAGGVLLGAAALAAVASGAALADMRLEERGGDVKYAESSYTAGYAAIGVSSAVMLIGAGLLGAGLAPQRSASGSTRAHVGLGGGPGVGLGLTGRF